MYGYRSVMASSANEDGHPEIEIERKWSLFRWLFRRPKVETFVLCSPGIWYNKTTGKKVSVWSELHNDLTIMIVELTPYDFDHRKWYNMTQPNGEVL